MTATAEPGVIVCPLLFLADALMDAGADSKEMIWHARENGAYVAGDWLLNLILGDN